ncbi:LysR substrate-binding domain-containing protein [Nocardia implantans]|uniref:LysR substrate-binding domain-containing protein n=1 Tax=Nocardia implantans TaxID=3108168 RepID=A0ABU6B469_9NOCA|nr:MULTISPECIES: LysR substrate-binding domain-containing protein [unclassified Nocardia]MBF6196258.1 LysR family transcriptional regulator [Nocardia beijingensis]MEA3527778.1 LysR substrate-binding domain-containing protein [Nocardia sp. CDC192]MEB3514516.1 LysR substrate-binding domain-containing protein [Nocardia sp. CDC186]
MSITVPQARSFLAVAEDLNYTRAARRLHMSPSSLSEQITTIERRLGRRLFRRTSRHVELTESGAALRPLATRLVEAADELEHWATTGPTTIRLGCPVSSPRFRALLAMLTTTMPEVEWRVRRLPFAQAYSALIGATVDCVFVAETAAPPASVQAIALWREDAIVVLPDDHRLASRELLHVDDLLGETFVTTEDPATSERWLAGISPGGAPPKTLPAASTLDEALDLCGAGMGINIAGSFAPDTYARKGIRFIPLEGVPPRTTYLCLRREAHSPGLQGLIRTATEARSLMPDRS